MSLKSTLSDYNSNFKLMEEHAIKFDVDSKRKPHHEEDDGDDSDYIQLKLYSN